MQQVFFIHGAAAYSRYEDFLKDLRTSEIRNPTGERSVRWSDTLRGELGDTFEVFTPSMPNKQNAKYEEWKIWFERHFEYLHDDLILVGWSQGGYFLAKYLIENETSFTIKALILVAAPFSPDDFSGEDGGDFSFDTGLVERLAKRAAHVHLFHSEDDFVVPYSHALRYKESVPAATLHAFTDRGHFLQSEFPELVELITSISDT